MKHLAIRNPPTGRIGCWNTVILTACGIETKPEDTLKGTVRDVTRRIDMTTCPVCIAYANANPHAFKDGVTL